MSQGHDEEGFGLSIGDVMSALLLIIILLMMTMLQQLKEQIDRSSEFEEKQEELYEALHAEFSADLDRLNMRIEGDGEIRFVNPEILFDAAGGTRVKPEFKTVLREFFPRYLRVLSNQEFKEEIREIRIEGHTDTTSSGSGDPYLNNLSVSQTRSYRVLKFLLEDDQIKRTLDSLEIRELPWFREKTVGMGFSFNKLLTTVQDGDTILDMDGSRRVSFRPLIDFERYMYLSK